MAMHAQNGEVGSSNSVHTDSTCFQTKAIYSSEFQATLTFPQEYVKSDFILQGLNSHSKYKSLSKCNTSVVHEFQGDEFQKICVL